MDKNTWHDGNAQLYDSRSYLFEVKGNYFLKLNILLNFIF